MEALPAEVQRAIRQDALLMRMYARRQRQMYEWLEPLFHVWAKIVHYERQWPGSTSEAGSVALA